MALATRSAASTRVASARPARRASVVVRASAQNRRELLGFGAAALLATLTAAAPAKADLTTDLLARSSANKALNDKKRLATSSANVARSRTVADGTCRFPYNMFGCETAAAKYTGGVRFIADDYALECQGKEDTKCANRMQVKYK
ncbi:chloroplast photosystem I subunit N [Scenedesmus sp. NREL 46B-D3]|nr:chloroplast photosystem I subunit N [Scenedesmus sp. NREL 46B-D3]